MNTPVVQLKKYMKQNPLNLDEEDGRSLLEFFGSYYRMYNPILIDELRERFRPLEPVLKSLSHKRERRLFHTILEVCEEYERDAFLAGVRTGAQLIMELSESK